MKRFGVIVCDNQVKWQGAEGVGRRLEKSFKDENEEWTIFKACEGEQPTEDDIKSFDGFLISGSASSVNDNTQWMRELEFFIQSLAKSSTKGVGICFGHQLIGKALGGKVGKNPSQRFVFQAEDIQLSDELKTKSWSRHLIGTKNSVTLLESHGEVLMVPPVGAKILGRSNTCETEVMLSGDNDNIISVQSHPEKTIDQMKGVILPSLKSKKRLTEEEERFSVKSLDRSLDSENMIKILKNFLRE